MIKIILIFSLLFGFIQPAMALSDYGEHCIGYDTCWYDQNAGRVSCPPAENTTPGAIAKSAIIVGDSLSVGMLGEASKKFEAKGWHLSVNGVVSRPLYGPQFRGGDGLSVIDTSTELRTTQAVIIELGTNDPGDLSAHLPEAIDKIRTHNPAAQIYWVDLGPNSRYSAANKVIRDQAGSKNYQVIEWSKIADTYLHGDVHPDTAGYAAMAELVAAAVTGSPSPGSTANCNNGGGVPGVQPADFQKRNVAAGKRLAAERGWGDGAEFDCLYTLWDHESGWNERADNPSSDAYGIPQALPGKKMAEFGSDWATNPETQIKWGLKYIADRYKTPCNAWSFWQSKSPHWY